MRTLNRSVNMHAIYDTKRYDLYYKLMFVYSCLLMSYVASFCFQLVGGIDLSWHRCRVASRLNYANYHRSLGKSPPEYHFDLLPENATQSPFTIHIRIFTYSTFIHLDSYFVSAFAVC